MMLNPDETLVALQGKGKNSVTNSLYLHAFPYARKMGKTAFFRICVIAADRDQNLGKSYTVTPDVDDLNTYFSKFAARETRAGAEKK